MSNESGHKPVSHTKKHIARLERERQQTRIILYIFFGILITVLALLAYGILDVKYFQLRKPVATVNGVDILAGEFESRVRLQRQQLLGQFQTYMNYQDIFGMDMSQQLGQIQAYLDNPEFLGQSVLDQMIREEVIRQEADKRGITVSEEELNEFIQTEFRYFPNGTFTPTVTPTQVTTPEPPAAAFEVVTQTPIPASPTATVQTIPTIDLTTSPTPSATATATFAPTGTPTAGPTFTPQPTATPYTLEGFQGEYNKSLEEFARFDIPEEDYRDLMRIQLIQKKLEESVLADMTNMEEQVWARHILVSDQALAVTIIERLKAGEDFAALAMEFSEDTGSAVLGGDLGWFGAGAMVPEFETAAFALEKPGDITETPVQSQFGYHIIQLIAKQERPLDASQYEQARTTAFEDWLTQVRDGYEVEQDGWWKSRVPTEPNFITAATEGAAAAQTQNAEFLTGTPTPEE
jgi:parvulin-like peptidyl-prolyl isomerase